MFKKMFVGCLSAMLLISVSGCSESNPTSTEVSVSESVTESSVQSSVELSVEESEIEFTSIKFLSKDDVIIPKNETEEVYVVTNGNCYIDDIEIYNSNPSVASTSLQVDLSDSESALIICKINAKAIGKTEIYVQTKDGSLKTDNKMITVTSTKSKPESGANSDMSEKSSDIEDSKALLFDNISDFEKYIQEHKTTASKEITVIGIIKSVNEDGYIILKDHTSVSNMIIDCKLENKEDISSVHLDDIITINGEIDDLTDSSYHSMRNCEVLNISQNLPQESSIVEISTESTVSNEYSMVESSIESSAVSEQSNTIFYVLNTNTKKIHFPTCSYVDKIDPENYATTYDFHSAIAEGYEPCKKCNPHG